MKIDLELEKKRMVKMTDRMSSLESKNNNLLKILKDVMAATSDDKEGGRALKKMVEEKLDNLLADENDYCGR